MNIEIANDKEFFYQWDTGQMLEITDDGSGSEVHIEKDDLMLACAIREENGVRLVDVPDLLLQGDGYLTAFLVRKVEDEVETLFSKTFRIEHRAKPEDYVCTETEILHYRDLAERITALEQNGGSTGGGIAEESDPTVQSWAKTPLTAEVGQFFKVSAVDENGKVTAVEAVDVPNGGSSTDENWELIADVTTTEEVSVIDISVDTNGNPFSLSKMDMLFHIVGTETNTANDAVRVNINAPSTNTAFRIVDEADIVRALSTQSRKGEAMVDIIAGSVTGRYSFTSNTEIGLANLKSIRKLPVTGTRPNPIALAEIDSVNSISVYPKTSGSVFGIGTIIRIYGVSA